MARKVFKSIKALQNYAKDVSRDVLEKVIVEEAKDILLDAIQLSYDQYTSRADVPYDRRYANGGLLDRDTIKAYFSSDGLSVRLRQETTSDTGGSLFVDVYVTQGNLYNWSNSEIYGKQPFPRDFYKYAKDMLEKEMPSILQKAFKNKGIKTEKINVNVRF